jgi:cytochrome c-type protein NapB
MLIQGGFPMRLLLRCCGIPSLIAALALPVIVSADEHENYEKDAQQAEGTPPRIPHHITDTSDGTYCLGCHRTGLNGAPETPHPERLTCTQCHVPGEIKEMKPGEKGINK